MSAIVVPGVRATLVGTAVPNEWKTNNAANRIADYLREARQNREALFTVIDRLLQ